MGVLAGQAQIVLSRLRLVDELNRQNKMLETVLRHSPVGVVLEDEAGNVAYANSEVERIYGVEADALIGTPAQSLLGRADAAVVAELEPAPGRPQELRLAVTGTVVQVRRVPIPGSAEQPARVLTLHEDVTQERAVLEAKELMLRAIGHEVRSPAAAMRSTIAGLLQWGTVMDADQRHSLIVEAYEQSERLLSLVENQLLIAKLEAGSFEPNRHPMALGRSMEQVMTVLRNRYGPRVDVIDVRLSPDLPDAYCEPIHLDQVLSNLIGNALEYTRAHRVRVSARAHGDWLEVTVADDGSGLSPEREATLFAKNAPAGRNRARGGLGLGLYLCSLVVERSFGGRIWLDGTGPTGTTFKFTVPTLTARPEWAVGAVR
jgi:PAS domain S-box-containing protein